MKNESLCFLFTRLLSEKEDNVPDRREYKILYYLIKWKRTDGFEYIYCSKKFSFAPKETKRIVIDTMLP